MEIRSYKDLVVWQKSMELVVACYQAAAQLPSSERFGLIDQIRRSVVSIPANIAEGHGRNHTREFMQHLGVAYASLMELETHLRIAERLEMLPEAQAADLLARADRIGKMLSGLKNKLQQKRAKS